MQRQEYGQKGTRKLKREQLYSELIMLSIIVYSEATEKVLHFNQPRKL